MKRVLNTVMLPLLLVGGWAAYAEWSGSLYVPNPIEAVNALALWFPEGFTKHVLPSLLNIVLGLGIAVIAGVAGGSLIALNRTLEALCMPLIDWIRSIPKPALVPVAVLVFGIGVEGRVFIIALGSVWPVLLAAHAGVRALPTRYLDVARVQQLTPLRTYLQVIIPGASGQIFAGIRTAVGIAVVMMVVSEMMAASNGVGHFIIASQRSFDMPEMWAGILTVGLLSLLLTGLVAGAERALLRWRRGAHD